MAGSYPDYPSRRMAYDADGTIIGVYNATNAIAEVAGSTLIELNDEDMTPMGDPWEGKSGSLWVSWIFPELREVDGFIFREDGSAQGSTTLLVEESGDTTNGRDGTWSTVSAALPITFGGSLETWRTGITSLAQSNVRSLRINYNYDRGAPTVSSVYGAHVFGEITPGQTPDKLLFIDELTGLEFTTPIDFGDTPRGGSEDREFRIRNDSASLTANNIQYTAEDLYLGSSAWYTYTLPGGATFQATQQLTSLAPATTSGIITLRRITPGTGVLGLHAARTYLNVGSWT